MTTRSSCPFPLCRIDRTARLPLPGIALCVIVCLIAAGCGGEVPSSPIPEGDPLDGERINNLYTNEEIRYFLEVALGDSADGNDEPRIRKWLTHMRLRIKGDLTPEDSVTVLGVASQLNKVLPDVEIVVTDFFPDVTIVFAHEDEFHLIVPDIEPGSGYLFRFSTDLDNAITDGTILIPSDSIWTQDERDYLIMQGMTRILGFLYDSIEYPESIFYEWWNWRTELAPIDRKVIEIMYQPEIQPGMTRAGVIAAMTTR